MHEKGKVKYLHDRTHNYIYNVEPFELKDVGGTYQRMMNMVYEGKIDEIPEVYVDNMIIKSNEKHVHKDHLTRVF